MGKNAKNKHNAELRGANILKSMFLYEQKYDFWPIRTRFDPLKGTLKFIFFNVFFSSNITCLSFIVTLSLLAKKSVPLVKSKTFGSLAPFALFKKKN